MIQLNLIRSKHKHISNSNTMKYLSSAILGLILFGHTQNITTLRPVQIFRKQINSKYNNHETTQINTFPLLSP